MRKGISLLFSFIFLRCIQTPYQRSHEKYNKGLERQNTALSLILLTERPKWQAQKKAESCAVPNAIDFGDISDTCLATRVNNLLIYDSNTNTKITSDSITGVNPLECRCISAYDYKPILLWYKVNSANPQPGTVAEFITQSNALSLTTSEPFSNYKVGDCLVCRISCYIPNNTTLRERAYQILTIQ